MLVALPEIPVPDEPHHFTIGLLATLLLMFAALLVFVVRTYTHAKQANQAVNNVGPGEHSLWDRVDFIHEDVRKLVDAQDAFTEKGWTHLPPDLHDAPALTSTIREIQNSLDRNDVDHARIFDTLEALHGTIRELGTLER